MIDEAMRSGPGQRELRLLAAAYTGLACRTIYRSRLEGFAPGQPPVAHADRSNRSSRRRFSDPMTPLMWVSKSHAKLAAALRSGVSDQHLEAAAFSSVARWWVAVRLRTHERSGYSALATFWPFRRAGRTRHGACAWRPPIFLERACLAARRSSSASASWVPSAGTGCQSHPAAGAAIIRIAGLLDSIFA
jgi:hypothetical protein